MPPNPDPRENARRHATQVGCASAKARGLDDWDAIALQAAEEAERLYLDRHHIRPLVPGEEGAE